MIKLNYYGVLKNTVKSNGISEKKLFNINAKSLVNMVFHTHYTMDGWVDLPLTDAALIKQIKSVAEHIKTNYTTFVVLGVGGSALGAKTIFKAFEQQHSGVNCLVFDNIDPEEFAVLVKGLNLKQTMFNVITKSGTTSETILQMLLVAELLDSKKLKLSEHLIITTEKENDLYNFATQNQITTFIVPKGVGGRYSVFSPVGLLPASVYGVDITKLLKGAKTAYTNSQIADPIKNVPLLVANIHYNAYCKGKKQLVVMPYSQRLSLVTDYFAQLWAESLGKKVNNAGRVVNLGTTALKAVGITDQHSQLQLYAEGKNDKLFMFIKTEKADTDWMLKQSKMAKFDYFNGVSLKQLLTLENVATEYSLTKNGRPNYSLTLPSVTPESVGELLYMLQVATAFSGIMFNVNAFDQPGVEDGKIYTKALLGLSQYTNKKLEIDSYITEQNKHEVK